MSAVTLDQRQKINHELKKLGFGGIADPTIFQQIATLYKTHESFRGLLMSTMPDQRRIAYEALRPHLSFTPKPLDVYEREIHEKAEREQWDVIYKDNPHWPQPFKVSEIETEEYKLARLAEQAIEDAEHEKAKGMLEMVCKTCTVAEYFPAPKRKQAVKAAHDAGWRWDERNGSKRSFCPTHVPGRATMKLACSACGKNELMRVWDQQDGYAKARVAGWEFGSTDNDEKCLCPRCAAPRIVLQ